MSVHIMVDLETLGKQKNACIVALGAYYFDTKEPTKGESFYLLANPESSLKTGLQMDADTVLWWLGQSEDARNELLRCREGASLAMVLASFASFYQGCSIDQQTKFVLKFREENPNCTEEDCLKQSKRYPRIPVWGNGATFDNVILSTAYGLIGQPVPWQFTEDRCYRTLKNLCPQVPMVRTGTHHNALEDCKSQALHLSAIYEHLKLP